MSEQRDTVFLIAAEKRGKHGTVRRYVLAPDGSLLHTNHDTLVPLIWTTVKSGWRKVVAEELRPAGDHYERISTVTVTPPKRRRTPTGGSSDAQR